MHTLSNKDLQLFEQLASIKQPVLLKTMSTYLQKHYDKVTMTRDYVFAEGDIPVALVAHLDTVFKRPPSNIYYDERKGVIWSPEGLGADDRAGVFAIVKIIESGLRPHIIFTTDEEIGGIGAENLTKVEKEPPFKDLKYIIQLDRQGTNDCVFYECDNKSFIKYVESFGFSEAFGSFSDISVLCPAWKVAGTNLSIGYKDEHSVSETLHVAPMMATIRKVKNMLADGADAKHYKWIPSKYYKYYPGVYGTMTGYPTYPIDDEDWLDYMYEYEYNYGYGNRVICEKCHQSFDEYETFPVKMLDGSIKHFCGDCIIDNVEWCEECQEAFEIDPEHPTERICPDCKEELKKKYQKNKNKGK